MNKIPKKLKWGYKIYEFKNGKGNTLCYVNNPEDIYDDSDGELLIIQYRPKMSPKDRFYVLYYIQACPHYTTSEFGSAKIYVNNISGKQRMAIPIWE